MNITSIEVCLVKKMSDFTCPLLFERKKFHLHFSVSEESLWSLLGESCFARRTDMWVVTTPIRCALWRWGGGGVNAASRHQNAPACNEDYDIQVDLLVGYDFDLESKQCFPNGRAKGRVVPVLN